VENTASGSAGADFARLRFEAGLTIRELADAAHVWPSSVSRVERGGFVRREVRDALVTVLGEPVRPLIAVRNDRPDTPVYAARLRTGESGRQVAKRAGVSKDAFARAERGERVSPATASRIAKTLGLDVTDMATLIDDRRVA
jgi:transcriptional regulator with XRE-family HTH domain